jgi:hypothetical protein
MREALTNEALSYDDLRLSTSMPTESEEQQCGMRVKLDI